MQKQQDIATLRSIHARGNPHGGVNAAPLPVTGYPDMPVVILVMLFWKQGQPPRLGRKGTSKGRSRGTSIGCTMYAGSNITNASTSRLRTYTSRLSEFRHACNSTDGSTYCCTDHLVDLFRSLQGSPLNEHCFSFLFCFVLFFPLRVPTE